MVRSIVQSDSAGADCPIVDSRRETPARTSAVSPRSNMSTPNPVLDPTPGRVPAWIRDRSHWLVAVAAVAVIAAVLALAAGPRMASEPAEVGGVDERHAVPGMATESPPRIDHSVVESKSLLDEPDMIGASIGTYAP
jgi:hypothetical protein